MTLDEFIEELRKTPRTWHLGLFGLTWLRNHENCCPILAVGKAHPSASFTDVGRRLGLDDEVALEVALAADNHVRTARPGIAGLRARLLEACGVDKATPEKVAYLLKKVP